MKEYFSKINNINMLSSIIFIIIGTILIFNPEGTLQIISYLIGALFIFMGVVKIFNYFSDKRTKNTYFNDDLVYGIVMIIIGIFAVASVGILAALFRFIVALWIIYNGVLRMVYTFRFKKYGDSMWVVNLVLSIAIIACGAYVLCNSGILIQTVGVFILIYAIMDLVESVIFAKNIKLLSN